MRSRKLTRSRSLAIGVALALTIAACGGDDDDSGSDDDTESTEAPEETEEADETESTEAPEETESTEAPEETETTEAPDEEMEQVSIRFTWWGNPERDEKTGAMIDAFMEAYPEINVEAEPTVFDGYFDKLAVSFAAGDAPDLMTLGGSYPTEYGSNGVLTDINDVADTAGLANFDPNSYSASTLDGAVYGLPTGGNARGLLVNVALFEEAGIELPDDSAWTWADYVTLAGDLSAALSDDVFGTDWRIQDMKEEYAAQRGTEMYLAGGGLGVDVATMTELYTIPADLLANGGMPSAEVTTELTDTTMEQTLFGQGKAAMMFGYSNNVQSFADLVGGEVAMIKIPGESEFAAPGLSVLPSQFFSIYSGSDHQEETALLLNWMLNEPEPAKIILANRGLSFNPSVLEAISPLLAEYEAQSADYLTQVASEGRASLPVPTEGKGEVDDVTLRLQDEVIFGLSSPADAAQQWIDEASSIIP